MKQLPLYFLLCLAGLLAAWGMALMAPDEATPEHPGLRVYLGEGCIHCHSQYRRPEGVDLQMWGSPSDPVAEADRQHPVLFGNRRQGPDLSNVGLRRSRQWNRLHLQQPREVRRGSRMPSYAYLFRDDDPRGEALLDYLQSLGEENREQWLQFIASWQPEVSLSGGDPVEGERLYREYCAGCHGARGRGNGPVATQLEPAPRDLAQPSGWIWVTPNLAGADRRLELARLIKFGRPGTSMAGTEWLEDRDLANLIGFVDELEQNK